MYHVGAIVVAPGYSNLSFSAGSNTYAPGVAVGEGGSIKEAVKEAVIHQAKRTVTIAGWNRQNDSEANAMRNEE